MWRNTRTQTVLLAVLCLMVFSLFLQTGCRSRQASDSVVSSAPASQMAPAAEEAVSPDVSGGYAGLDARSKAMPESDINQPARTQVGKSLQAEPNAPGTGGPVLSPQLIRQATVTMKVDRLTDAVKRTERLVKLLGGYITTQNMSLSEETSSYRIASLTIRLPQTHLDRFLEEAGNVGKILSENISATDVSKELVDTEARIRNLQAEEKALQQIMNRTGKIPEVLEVSRELARVRGEIEQAQGSLNYMRSQVAYATVNLTLSEKMVTASVDTQPGIITVVTNTVKEAWSALYGFILGMVGLVIWLIFFLPVVGLILYGMGWGIRWMVLRAHRNWQSCRKKQNTDESMQNSEPS